MKSKTFDCPCCGNEIYRTNKEQIKCPWCETVIIPKGNRKDNYNRESKIYEPHTKRGLNEEDRERKEDKVR